MCEFQTEKQLSQANEEMADKKPVLAHSNGDKRSKSSLTCVEYADERAADNTSKLIRKW